MTPAVSLKNIDIIFGKAPEKALPLLDQGWSRDEINRKTGQVVGVSGANLEVNDGEIVVLMGLSGSGKSTLLRAVNALAPVTRGTVTVQTPEGPVTPYNTSKRTLRKLRLHTISMVFQQFALLPWRSVEENIGFPLELAGFKAEQRHRRVQEQLALVGLSQWARHPVSALSGGMQQRVGLARAFVTGAPVLLMDEPFSALDPLIRLHMQDELLELQRTLKKTILFVSHDLDEAFRIGNRIAIMQAGRIVQLGTPAEILRKPANAYVADFIGNINPGGILTAADIMTPITSREQLQTSVSGTVKPETVLNDILRILSAKPGTIGVIERGRIVGIVNAQSAISSLSHSQKKP
ncbi:quaternary amine ABC transporter ATP-binding protein [Martelella mediterranea]|uniref:Glycine betaine/proline transport system ATP-binding protein n=1 Tax=Martelella mediterranea TaxID=293089 RepID=A0A4R3NCL8_9HYPH|nr:ATP-binding cassette domain-containing protein [Martelella mediterranea]TCT27573.1 glycine betaine/proline transport system ATP-binding protein [Martelella mediterranea]